MEENNTFEENKINGAKKSNKKLLAIIVGVAVVLALTVGVLAKNFMGGSGVKAVNLRTLEGTPQEIIIAAMKNNQDQARSEAQWLEEKTGGKVLQDILSSEAVRLGFECTLDSIEGDEQLKMANAYIKGVGLVGDLAYTKDGDKFDASLKAKQGQLELLGYNVYKDGTEVGMDIPQLFDNPYAIKLDTFVEDYKNSAFREITGETDIDQEQLDELVAMYKAVGEYMNGILTIQSNPEYMDKFQTLYEEMIRDIDFTENGTKTVTCGSKSEVCKVYSAPLTAEQCNKYSKQLINTMLEFDFMQSFIEFMAKEQGITKDEVLNQITSTNEEIDYDVNVEIWTDEHFIRGGTIHLANHSFEEATTDIELRFAGEKYISDETYLSIRTNGGVEAADAVFTLTNNMGENSDVVKSGITLDVSSAGETMSMTYDLDYNTKAQKDNLNMNLKIEVPDEGKILLAAKGDKVVNASTKEISTTIHEISYDIEDGDYHGKLNLVLNFVAKAIKPDDIQRDTTRETKYILEMSMEELTSVMENIQASIEAFSGGLF